MFGQEIWKFSFGRSLEKFWKKYQYLINSPKNAFLKKGGPCPWSLFLKSAIFVWIYDFRPGYPWKNFLKHFSIFVPFKTIIKIDNFRCLKKKLLKLTTFGQHTIEKIFINNPKFWVEGSRKWFLRNSMIFGKKEFKNIHDLLSEDP